MKIKQLITTDVEVNEFPFYTKSRSGAGMLCVLNEKDSIEIYNPTTKYPIIYSYSDSTELVTRRLVEYPILATKEEWDELLATLPERVSQWKKEKLADIEADIEKNLTEYNKLTKQNLTSKVVSANQ